MGEVEPEGENRTGRVPQVRPSIPGPKTTGRSPTTANFVRPRTSTSFPREALEPPKPPWPNEAQAITMERCVPCSAAPLVFPREQAAAPVKLRTPVLAAGVFFGHPHGHGRPSGCLPPLAGRSHF